MFKEKKMRKVVEQELVEVSARLREMELSEGYLDRMIVAQYQAEKRLLNKILRTYEEMKV